MSTHEEAIEAANKKLHSIIGAGDYINVNLAAETIAAYLAARSAVLCSSEPVAWTDDTELNRVKEYGHGLIWDADGQKDMRRSEKSFPLYRSTKSAVDEAAQAPFAYWVEHKFAEPVVLRPQSYIPDGPNYTVTPLYARPQSAAAPLSPTDAATAGLVEVKTLEWKDDLGLSSALTCLGVRYTVWEVDDDRCECNLLDGAFSTIPNAKAAAQADYSARILSAITHPQPSNGDEVERLREALQTVVDWAALALKNPGEFNSHGVRLLDGPAFDAARAALKGSSHDQR